MNDATATYCLRRAPPTQARIRAKSADPVQALQEQDNKMWVYSQDLHIKKKCT